jgi:hypothetical protein
MSYDVIIPTGETASLNNLIIIIYNYIYNFYTQKEDIPQVIHTKNCSSKLFNGSLQNTGLQYGTP